MSSPAPAPLFPRLGLTQLGLRYRDRLGMLTLSRGKLAVSDGALTFSTSGASDLPAGVYAIPQQALTALLLGPGSSVSHEALRLLAAGGTTLLVTGDDGIRLYNPAVPPGHGSSVARAQAMAWAHARRRQAIARRLYGNLLGYDPPAGSLAEWRGLEGVHFRACYARLAAEAGLDWQGRDARREAPDLADRPNQALNHASSAVRALAGIAVQAVGAIAQLGFIHEDDSSAFVLDLADQFREGLTIPAAFAAACAPEKIPLERRVRQEVAERARRTDTIGAMILRISQLFGAPDADPRPA